ncbi:MAG TPA: ABC transporter permease subunit [Solirubrobacteraceae bacterium]
MSAIARPSTQVPVPQARPAPDWPASLRAVVRRGLRDQRRSILTWGLSLGVYGAFMASIYPSIQNSVEKIAKNYPESLKQAFGVQAMSTVEGYIHAEMFSLIVPLALGFFAIRAIAGATVGAEERGRLDTILALPISRRVLITGAYLVTAVACALIMAMTGVMIYLAARIAGTSISLGLVAAGVMGVWPLTLLFAGVAALAAGALHSARTVTGLGLGTLVGMYAVDLAGRLAPSLDPIRWASAFRYYGAPMRDGIDPVSFLGLAGVGVLLLLAAAVLFDRRDVLN